MKRALTNLRRANSGHGTEINATPLIDVVMCLIVFYLIVGKMAADQLSPVELPRTALGAQESGADALIVNVLPRESGASSMIVVEREELADAAALEAVIRARLAADPGAVVQVRGDRRLAFGDIDPVLRACAAAGARSVRLMSEQSP